MRELISIELYMDHKTVVFQLLFSITLEVGLLLQTK